MFDAIFCVRRMKLVLYRPNTIYIQQLAQRL